MAPRREALGQISDSEKSGELKQTTVTTCFGHRDTPAIHFHEVIRANIAPITLHEVQTERDRQDGDDDHEPVAVFAKNLDHGIGWAANLRIPARPPSGLLVIRALRRGARAIVLIR